MRISSQYLFFYRYIVRHILPTPAIKQLTGSPRLKHPRRSKDDRWPTVVKRIGIDALEVAYELEIEGVADIHLGTDSRIHHIRIGLADPEGTASEFGCIIYGNRM